MPEFEVLKNDKPLFKEWNVEIPVKDRDVVVLIPPIFESPDKDSNLVRDKKFRSPVQAYEEPLTNLEEEGKKVFFFENLTVPYYFDSEQVREFFDGVLSQEPKSITISSFSGGLKPCLSLLNRLSESSLDYHFNVDLMSPVVLGRGFVYAVKNVLSLLEHTSGISKAFPKTTELNPNVVDYMIWMISGLLRRKDENSPDLLQATASLDAYFGKRKAVKNALSRLGQDSRFSINTWFGSKDMYLNISRSTVDVPGVNFHVLPDINHSPSKYINAVLRRK